MNRVLPLILLACVPVFAYADDTRVAPSIADINKTVGVATTDTATAAANNDAAEITAGTKDKNASISISLPSLTSATSDSIADLVISAPLDSNNEGQLATLDGFSQTYSLEINYKQSVFNSDVASPTAINEECLKIADEIESGWKGPCGKSSLNGLVIKHEADLSKQGKLAAIDQKIDDYVKKAFGINGSILDFYGLTFKSGANNYKYVDSSTVMMQTVNKDSYSGGVYYGWLTPHDGLFALQVNWQKVINEGKSGTVCGPPNGSNPIMCSTGAVGAPKTQYKNIFSVSYRNEYSHFAISPSLNYDSRAHTFGVDLPIYLIRDTNSLYSGGIRFGWRDDTHEFTGTLFVGANFNYFSQ